MTFRLGSALCEIEVAEIQEVIKFLYITPVPDEAVPDFGPDFKTDYLRGIARTDTSIALLLDTEAVLAVPSRSCR